MVLITEFPPLLRAGHNGGRVQSISVSPIDTNHIIVANQFGGLWKTEDGGVNWFHLDSLLTVFVHDISYAPDGNTVVATLKRDNQVNNGGGIYVSRDGGSSWLRPPTAYPPTGRRISAYGISYAPDNNNLVYVGTDYGIAISGDNGNTWLHYTASTVRNNPVISVKALSSNKAIALTETGVYRTNNRGRDWYNIELGNFAYMLNLGCCKNIDVSPFDENKIFILRDYYWLLLYRLDSGRLERIRLAPLAQYNGIDYIARGPFVRISKTPDDRLAIWVGQGFNLIRAICSDDIDQIRQIDSSSWSIFAWGEGVHPDSSYLALNNNMLPILYGSDGGLFKPANIDANMWTSTANDERGTNSLQITDLGGTNVRPRHGVNHTSLYFSTQDNNIWGSPNSGIIWPNWDAPEGFFIQVRKDAESDNEVTVAYANVVDYPQVNMFSDANLVNGRPVPNRVGDEMDLGFFAQAFFISPRNWVRYRKPPTGGNREIYISQDNGLTWRKRADVSLEEAGVFAVSGTSSNPVIFAPFRYTRGSKPHEKIVNKIGLLKLDDVFGQMRNYSQRDIISLPQGGSLGRRATEFDWQAVYGVDPNDPDYIIAPDIYNQVVKVSRNRHGSLEWITDVNLTSKLTGNGRFLLYDEDEYHMQVTRISFDPYNQNRILIGTRDAGIIMSEDMGRTWTNIRGSEIILYITNFFFISPSTVIVSSYGRGLWKIDLNFYLESFPFELYCKKDCIIRRPSDPETIVQPIDWSDKDVTIFLNGAINGMEISGNEVKTITATPGTVFNRYITKTKDYRELNIIETDEGVGFNGLRGCLEAVQSGEIIKGIIQKEKEIIGIISGKDKFSESIGAPSNESDNTPGEISSTEPDSNDPYLFITTNLPISGVPVVGNDLILYIFARGFRFDPDGNAKIELTIDEEIVDQTVKVMENGIIQSELKISAHLSQGKHILKIMQKMKGEEITASSMFVKAAGDDYDEEKKSE